ncbi:MFS transporter [Novosphingobium album (ex Hu et al. 2023)]|uniref:MFS transporter n=1 Tax=Novosphingobium album (ex Hu et al. 2023) TaxID=2930093 RepID=A0ABT0B7B5_9SPHN|nr:MFS transporter [Novosphingobium album (ex Hu et al. 2023)]MCJ2180704.1 MFS transporter [Novosphingobium album (ex Hu et al. 2023)]
MLQAILPVRSLLIAIFMLMAGGGFMNTLVSVRLERAGSGALPIGLVGTAYFAGLVIGSLRAPALVRRVGHIRAFAAFVAVVSASTLVYAVYRDVLLWGLLRFTDGFCLAGVYVCIESWLNERAKPETRGAVLAGYMIALYSGQALGQFLLGLGDTNPAMPLLVASILITLASIPVVLTHIVAPPPDEGAALHFRELYRVSPLGIIGVCMTGVMIGAFYALGAVYARRLGMNLSATALFMSIVILGGVALQWPLGRLSDRMDRRKVIVFSFAGAFAASLAIALLGRPGPVLLGLGALFGGLCFALYPLCVAHTNDHLAAEQRVAASSGLVLLYSLGAVIGPLAGSTAIALLGAKGLFLFIALCAGSALGFGLWRQTRSRPVPIALQEDYVILPRTTAVSASLDPVAPDDGPDDLRSLS